MDDFEDELQNLIWDGNPPEEDYSDVTFPITLEEDGPFGKAGDIIDLC